MYWKRGKGRTLSGCIDTGTHTLRLLLRLTAKTINASAGTFARTTTQHFGTGTIAETSGIDTVKWWNARRNVGTPS